MNKKILHPWWFYAFTSPLALTVTFLIYKYEKVWLKEWVTKAESPIVYYFALIVFLMSGLYAGYLFYKSFKSGENV